MTQNPTCPRCGSPLPAATPPAACPRCLLRIGLDTDFGGAPRSKRPPPGVEDIAREFPQLEILELLGQGGMGAVYKARQKSLDRLVALKILTVDTATDPSFAERFAREARALATLDHPNIVHVHDSGRAGEHFYLLMEYVEGIDLRHMLRAGRIAPREGLAIVVQICDALQYAHDQGVVHRDIKPENILVDRRGRVKIADFGLAKIVGRADDAFALTGTHQAMGTPHYMAPEQISHPQDVDHRADIYSLGVVLYELLTGELPLGRFVPPSKRVEVDVRIDEVVLKALERDLPLRYQHASEVRTSIDGLATPAPASTEKIVRHVGAPAPKSQTLIGLAILAAVSLVFVIGLTVAWWERLEKGETTLGRLAIIIGPWFLIGVCSAVLLVVGLARRARAASRPVWPWFLGAGCLAFVAAPLGIALVLVLYGGLMSKNEPAGDPRYSVDEPERDAQAFFKIADWDGSGGIDFSESERSMGLDRESFSALDHDNTGNVTLKEFSARYRDVLAQGGVFATPSSKPGAALASEPAGEQHTRFCTEIDDATAIRARSSRMEELGKLARRSGLSHHEQLHLAEALLAGGFFDENADGLLALMNNNELGPEAIQVIRTAMRGESPSSNRMRVLDALDREAPRANR